MMRDGGKEKDFIALGDGFQEQQEQKSWYVLRRCYLDTDTFYEYAEREKVAKAHMKAIVLYIFVSLCLAVGTGDSTGVPHTHVIIIRVGSGTR